MKGLFISQNFPGTQPVINWISVPKELFGDNEELSFIEAKGNGMKNAGINNGDVVIVNRDLQPVSGDIAMVLLDGKPFCRRVIIDGSKIIIRREDGKTPDIVTDSCIFLGVVVETIRRFRKEW